MTHPCYILAGGPFDCIEKEVRTMKKSFLSGFVLIMALCGCSSSSNMSADDDADSPAEGGSLRLITEQESFSNGNSRLTNYEYDDRGNLIGSVSGSTVLSYTIDPNGRIIKVDGSANGVDFPTSPTYFYDPVRGLRRIDFPGYIEGVGVIGVSAISLYEFDGNLATALEHRVIPFNEIALGAQVDDSAGEIVTKIEFEYDGERVIREKISENPDSLEDRQRDYTYNSDGTLSSVLETGISVVSYVYSYEQGACNLNWGNSTHRYFCVSSDGS